MLQLLSGAVGTVADVQGAPIEDTESRGPRTVQVGNYTLPVLAPPHHKQSDVGQRAPPDVPDSEGDPVTDPAPGQGALEADVVARLGAVERLAAEHPDDAFMRAALDYLRKARADGPTPLHTFDNFVDFLDVQLRRVLQEEDRERERADDERKLDEDRQPGRTEDAHVEDDGGSDEPVEEHEGSADVLSVEQLVGDEFAEGTEFYGPVGGEASGREQAALPDVGHDHRADDDTATFGSAGYDYVDQPSPLGEPSDPVETAELVEPVDPVEPGDTTEPVEATEPVDTTEPVEPIETAEPVEPVEPVDTTEPVEPVRPIETTQPVEPIETMEPVEPPAEPLPLPVYEQAPEPPPEPVFEPPPPAFEPPAVYEPPPAVEAPPPPPD